MKSQKSSYCNKTDHSESNTSIFQTCDRKSYEMTSPRQKNTERRSVLQELNLNSQSKIVREEEVLSERGSDK